MEMKMLTDRNRARVLTNSFETKKAKVMAEALSIDLLMPIDQNRLILSIKLWVSFIYL
jgi:hypothetical protein